MADVTRIGACRVTIAILLLEEPVENIECGNRPMFSACQQLVQELQLSDSVNYRNFLLMDMATFDELLRLFGSHIKYQDTNMRQAISAGERLALTLRFPATGEHDSLIVNINFTKFINSI